MHRRAISLPRLVFSLACSWLVSMALFCLGVDWFFPTNPPFNAGLLVLPTFVLFAVILIAIGPRARAELERGGRPEGPVSRSLMLFLTFMLTVSVFGNFLTIMEAAVAPGPPTIEERTLRSLEADMYSEVGMEPPPRRTAVVEAAMRFRYKVRALSLDRRVARGSVSAEVAQAWPYTSGSYGPR